MKKLIGLIVLISLFQISYSQTDTIRRSVVYNKVTYRELYIVKHSDMVKVKSAPGFNYANWECPATLSVYQMNSNGKYYLLKSGIKKDWKSRTSGMNAPPDFVDMLRKNKLAK